MSEKMRLTVYNKNIISSGAMAAYNGIETFPDEHTLKEMYKSGFRFKLDNKAIALNPLLEIIKPKKKK